MGLVIGIAVRVFIRSIGLALIFAAHPGLLVEIAGLRPPLVQEELAESQIFFAARGLIQPDQGHLRDLMARIALTFFRLRAEAVRHIVREAAGSLQQLVLSGGLIVGSRALRQMAQTVQLVMVPQVGEGPVHAVDDIIGVQIPAVMLGGTDQLNGLIRSFLQRGVRALGQGIRHGFDPLGEVRVLEHIAVEFVRVRVYRVLRDGLEAPVGIAGLSIAGALLALFPHHPCRSAEIVHTVAGLSVLHAVVKGFPLVGDHLCTDKLLLLVPEAVRHLNRP